MYGETQNLKLILGLRSHNGARHSLCMQMESVFQNNRHVAVIVSSQSAPKIQGVTEPIGSTLELDGEWFLDSGKGDWLGFYDWLRPVPGQVVGVRIWLDGRLPRFSDLKKCRGVELIKVSSELLIFFGHDKKFDESLSCDQDFGSNQLLFSNGRFALTFNGPD